MLRSRDWLVQARAKGTITAGNGRDVTRPTGDVTCTLSLEVSMLPQSRTRENRQENTILFQTLVSGAVMMIRPALVKSLESSMGDHTLAYRNA